VGLGGCIFGARVWRGYVEWFGQLGISLWREVHLRKHQVSGGGGAGVRSLFVVDYLAVYAT
jgi:hypothetical protein